MPSPTGEGPPRGPERALTRFASPTVSSSSRRPRPALTGFSPSLMPVAPAAPGRLDHLVQAVPRGPVQFPPDALRGGHHAGRVAGAAVRDLGLHLLVAGEL